MTIKKIYYSKNFKLKALMEVSQGKKFEDVLKSNGYDINFLTNRDKKYCSKLLSKWRKEFYQNYTPSHFENNKTNLDSLLYEIEILKYNEEIDTIMFEMEDKIKDAQMRLEKLRLHILETYGNQKETKKNKSLKNRFDK